jgi:hypothetical protein
MSTNRSVMRTKAGIKTTPAGMGVTKPQKYRKRHPALMQATTASVETKGYIVQMGIHNSCHRPSPRHNSPEL